MSEVIPLFKSHYSIGKSILTLEKKGEKDKLLKENPNYIGPESIIDLCLQNNIKHLFLVEDSMSSFLEAYLNSKDAGLKFSFGLRILVTANLEDKSEESIEKSSRYIIFAKNENGYRDLIRLYSIANRDGFYYYPRLDFKTLNKNWTDNLLLAIPFYDSFLHKNYFSGHICLPDFSKIQPIFFWENNGVPYDNQLKRRVFEYADGKYPIYKAKSVFYNKKEDFPSYMTFRCISSRTTLDKPELTNLCSDRFCLEDLK